MGYDKQQVAQEFTSWSESYDRSILQWLLFAPSHRVLIKRIREAGGDRPIKMLDVGCGTGLFASKVRTSCRGSRSAASTWSPTCWPRDSRVGDCIEDTSCRYRETANVCRSLRRSFDIVTCANSFHHYPRQDRAVAEMRACLAARRAADDHRRIPRCTLGLVHL